MAGTTTPEATERITLVGETPMTGVDVLDHFRLDGRTALVTGASSGLGKRIARVLHAAGADVCVTARRAERLTALCAELGTRATAHACDLSSKGEMEALVDGTIAKAGGIDMLVNDAGLLDGALGEEHEFDAPVLFLAGSGTSYVTGQTRVVDGGYLAR